MVRSLVAALAGMVLAAATQAANPVIVLETSKGDIKIELFYDAAPNHVRSFICLARAGYFDGLPFHASIRRGDKDNLQGYLESGCPKGTGEIGYGSIGYWLKPEIKSAMKHEEGTVGAWHLNPAFVDVLASRIRGALARFPDDLRAQAEAWSGRGAAVLYLVRVSDTTPASQFATRSERANGPAGTNRMPSIPFGSRATSAAEPGCGARTPSADSLSARL